MPHAIVFPHQRFLRSPNPESHIPWGLKDHHPSPLSALLFDSSTPFIPSPSGQLSSWPLHAFIYYPI